METISLQPIIRPADRIPTAEYLPNAYRSVELAERGAIAPQWPRNVFIEVTNHCNLLCETCPRTFTTYEDPCTLTWDNFLRIIDQFPRMERAVLHGIGEPLLNKDLPRMIVHLKARGVYVLFNTNATLLNDDWSAKLIESGLDELRISIDGANPRTYAVIRGAPLFDRVVTNLTRFIEIQRHRQSERPRASLWMTGLRENIAELPDVIRLAAQMGVPEVYLQRMVFYADDRFAPGMLNGAQAVYSRVDEKIDRIVNESEALAQQLGVTLRASGATTPAHSLHPDRAARPWENCLRPWTTAYVTANGNLLPCCIAPFATQDYESLKLGNLFAQNFAGQWNGERYQQWRARLLSDQPNAACAGCGVHWSL
jgi:MoaA/NifB/PqqE/SkfB family radical SAM enzyme